MKIPLLCVTLLLSLFLPAQSAPPPKGAPDLLQSQGMEEVLPATVFFAGKVATTQVRNSGGARAAGDKVTEFALVDASGYSSGIRERYQFYLLSSVPVEVGGKRLEAGAYGGGFLGGNALIMDLGGRELLQVPVAHEPELKRPRPLQVMADPGAAGRYRLYLGRDFVAFRQLP